MIKDLASSLAPRSEREFLDHFLFLAKQCLHLKAADRERAGRARRIRHAPRGNSGGQQDVQPRRFVSCLLEHDAQPFAGIVTALGPAMGEDQVRDAVQELVAHGLAVVRGPSGRVSASQAVCPTGERVLLNLGTPPDAHGARL